MRRLLLLLPALVAGCVPRTGDDLVDRVASRIDPFSNCVSVGHTVVFKVSNEPGPPALLIPTTIKDPEARKAAESVAIPWQVARPSELKYFGSGWGGRCPTIVDSPEFAGGFAFVTYHGPGGELGAEVFRFREGDWQRVETVKLGFW